MKSDWDVLVMDLDGTLLCAQGDVSDQNLHALDVVRDSGIEVVVATGRSYSECKHILDTIDHQGISITAGGSSLQDAQGNVLESESLQTEIVEEVTQNILQGNHRFSIKNCVC